LHKLDKNGDDKIDFEEFVKEMDNQSYYSTNHLEETFNYFDKDGTGLIDENELFEGIY
jgi:Ca2+-binding EF-hand superfamily protein